MQAATKARNGQSFGHLHKTLRREVVDRPSPPAARGSAAPRILEFHPLSALLPRMTEEEYAATRESIRRAGRVRQKGKLLDGKILDGRHRYQISRELGVPMEFDDFDPAVDGDPEQYVYDLAVGRHLTASQKAAAAVNFYERFEARAAERKRANGGEKTQGGGGGNVATSAPPAHREDPRYRDARWELLNARLTAVTKAYRRELGKRPPTGLTKDQLICALLDKRFAIPPTSGGGNISTAAPSLVSGKTKEQWRATLNQMSRKRMEELYKDRVGWFMGDISTLITSEMQDTILASMFGSADPDPEPVKAKARDEAGALFGVSPRYVQDAKFLKEKAPDLFDQVFNGQTPVARARREYDRREKQRSLAAKSNAARARLHALGNLPWEIIRGDALEVIEEVDPRPNLIFVDPRYNIGLDYGLGPKADATPEHDYLEWCRKWMQLDYDVLADSGSFFVMIDALHQADFLAMAKGIGFHWRNTIIWREAFGNYTPDNFTPQFRVIHYFTKHKTRFTWNGDDVLVPSDRQTVYGDKRAVESGKVPGNVWDFPRVVDNDPQRMPGFPTQLPLALVDRIVRVASEPGDLVLDHFNGTGTTGAASIPLGRRYVGIDVVERNVEWSRHRLTALSADLVAAGDNRGDRRG